ncbi:MAG: polyphenol oxidase family protein [Patescibacteria group bacterium]|nr:polyphenol oxidase family protein [Patescibacteria group bacterium]
MTTNSRLLSQFSELVYGFSTATDGNMSYKKGDPDADKNNRAFYAKLGVNPDGYQILNPELRHGSSVAVVKPNIFKRGYSEIDKYSNEVIAFEKGPLTFTSCKTAYLGIDACVSQRRKCLITIRPADCGPVFIYDPIKKVFGLMHASTASLFSGVVGRTINMMRGYFGSQATDIHCYIGPCISVSAYELCTTGLYKRTLHNLMTAEEASTYDPKEKIRQDLLLAGISEANIELSSVCTANSNGEYFSNHASAGKDVRRHLAVIGLR